MAVPAPAPREWLVTAMYMPKAKVRGGVETVSPGFGREFKFRVVGAETYVEAVETVRESGWFAGRIKEQFGFVAVRK